MRLTGKSVLIKPDKLPERTSSGRLIVPKSSKEMLSDTGTVVEIGMGCDEIRRGMRVIFPRKSANVIQIDNLDFYIVLEHQIKYAE